MSVNQAGFLGLFLLSVLLYYCVPRRVRWMVLLVISIYFYRLMGADTLLYVFISAVTLSVGTQRMYKEDRKLKQQMEREQNLSKNQKKILKNKSRQKRFRWLLGIIFINLGILLILKYGNFFIDNINSIGSLLGIRRVNHLGLAAPLGISYYTLQVIGYAIEVYKGKVIPEKNPLKILLFVTYYPQMTQGPIGRADLMNKLCEGHVFSFRNLSFGCQRILWGLMKKAVVSDNMKPLVQGIFSNWESVSGFTLVMGCIYMVLQMYADFSGYTDIVCGMSQIYGIEMMENFRIPLFSPSLGEYWRRWHISLSSWFRDYVFYPASISRPAVAFGKWGQRHFPPRIKKIFPVLFAMSLVWFCTGFWHDASWRYILWGVANGAVLIGGIILEPYFTKIKNILHIREDAGWWKCFCIIRTFLIVSLLKVFPGAGSTGESFAIIRKIFLNFGFSCTYKTFFMEIPWYTLIYSGVGLTLMLIVSLLQCKGPVRVRLAEKPVMIRWVVYALVGAVFILMGSFDSIVTGGFEYAQF